MATLLARVFDDRNFASLIASDLRERFRSAETHLIDGAAGTDEETLPDRMTRRLGISRTQAEAFAERIQHGAALVVVSVPFGSAMEARERLQGFHSIDPVWTSANSAGDCPAPLSAALGLPTLASEAAPLSKLLGLPLLIRNAFFPGRFGLPLLSGNPAPLSRAFGLRLLVESPAPLSRALGLPVLSKRAAPLSSLFGLPLLLRDAAPLSSLFGLPVLLRSPAPLSRLLRIPVLTTDRRDF